MIRDANQSLAEQIRELGPEFAAAWAKIPTFLRIKFPSMSDDDIHDVAVDSMLSVLAAVSRMPQGGASVEYPQAYLRQAATRAAYGHCRDQRGAQAIQLEESTPLMTDDGAAAAFDRSATAIDVRLFMRQLAESDDPTSYKVLSCVLDAIYTTGRNPTTREIAEICGLSHTGVSKSLRRIRERFKHFYTDD